MVSPLNKTNLFNQKIYQDETQEITLFSLNNEERILQQTRNAQTQEWHDYVRSKLEVYTKNRIVMHRISLEMDEAEKTNVAQKHIETAKKVYEMYAKYANESYKEMQDAVSYLSGVYDRCDFYEGLDDLRPDEWLNLKLEEVENEVAQYNYGELFVDTVPFIEETISNLRITLAYSPPKTTNTTPILVLN